MRDVYTLILAGGVGRRLTILTEHRAKPAVPFGGKFRIIDFALSNCANSGLVDVGLLTQYRPRSLIDHVGSGRVWDLDRTRGGLHVLQPSLQENTGGWYEGTADAVTRNLLQLLRRPVEDVVILSGDHVYAMDYRPFLEFHRARRFPATVAVTPVPSEVTNQFGMIRTSPSGVITEFQEKPEKTDCTMASMGVYVFRREALLRLLQEDAEDESSSHDFGKDIFPRLIKLTDVGAHVYDGYWQDIGTIESFYQDNMKLLDASHRSKFSRPDWPVRTPSVDAPPVRIEGEGKVYGSMVANGAVVRGSVEESILFPGVTVEPGARVRNCILMNQVHVESGAVVENAILDKRVRVGDSSTVGGTHEACPNQRFPELLVSGLTVFGKDVMVGRGSRVGRNVCVGGEASLGDGAEVQDGSFLDAAPRPGSGGR